MVAEIKEAVSLHEQMAELTPDEWARILPPEAGWDRAWENALALGAVSVAVPAMAAARRAGASLSAAALYGAAAAALELEPVLGPDDFAVLYAPVARILPRPERRLPAWGSTGAA